MKLFVSSRSVFKVIVPYSLPEFSLIFLLVTIFKLIFLTIHRKSSGSSVSGIRNSLHMVPGQIYKAKAIQMLKPYRFIQHNSDSRKTSFESFIIVSKNEQSNRCSSKSWSRRSFVNRVLVRL